MSAAQGDLPLGEVIYTAVKPIFKIYLIIGVGFYLARKNILTVETSKNISTIAIRVLIPCLTFQKIVTNINNRLIHEIATIVIIGYFMMFSQALLVFVVGVLAGCPRNWWGGLILCGLLPNISDLPIAYLQTMETANIFQNVDLGVSFVMIYMGLQLILQFTLGSYKLIEYDFKVDLKMKIKKEIQLEEGKLCRGSTPLEDTSSTSHTCHSKVQSNLENRQRQNSHNQSDIDELDDNDIHSIDSLMQGDSNFSEQGPRRIQVGAIILKHLTNDTGAALTKHASKVSVPNNILDNERKGMEPEGINDIVRVYSKYPAMLDSEKIESIIQNEEHEKNMGYWRTVKHFCKTTDWKSGFWSMMEVWKDSFQQPASVVLVISVVVAMVPWLQALFIESPQVHLPNAPDKQPPLSFIMDFAGYIGSAQVPFGLLLLGGTIGRLKVDSIPKKLWRVPIAVMGLRLFIFPIIGCAFNSKIHADGLFYNQDILYFLSNINFCLPPATSLLYITAFYTPDDGENHIQMDLLALVYIFHYIFLVFCLPFTATYTMKVSLGF